MKKRQLLVVGAGLTGASICSLVARSPRLSSLYNVTVYEKSRGVGEFVLSLV
jgi:predicted NAD/FAD-dependent oxidoreductase